MTYARTAALQAVDDARAAVIAVNQDLTMSAYVPGRSNPEAYRLQPIADQIAADLRAQAASMVAIDQDTTRKIVAATAGFGSTHFTETPLYDTRSSAQPIDYITRPKAPSRPFPEDSPPHPIAPKNNFIDAEHYIYDQIVKNQQSPWFQQIRNSWHSANPLRKADALHAFFDLVQTNGPWDHKPQLKELLHLQGDDFYLQLPGTNESIYYDIWSNLHYGYIGRAAGIPRWLLETAPNIKIGAVGVNDAADDIYVKAGEALFDKYGPDMTADQFHQGVLETISQLEAAQKADASIPQLRIK